MLLASNLAILGVFIAHRESIISFLDFPFPYLLFTTPLLLGSIFLIALCVPWSRFRPILRTVPILFVPLILYTYIGLAYYKGFAFSGIYLYKVPLFGVFIPVEEFLNWGILYPVWALLLFEWLSGDNQRWLKR